MQRYSHERRRGCTPVPMTSVKLRSSHRDSTSSRGYECHWISSRWRPRSVPWATKSPRRHRRHREAVRSAHEREPYQGVKVSRDQAYGADPRHLLDVFEPARRSGLSRPVLLFVHGGGFVAGDKHRPGSPYQDNVALWAVRHGMVGVNMTYRLAPQHPWPAARWMSGPPWPGFAPISASTAVTRRGSILMGTSAGAAHAGAYAVNARFHAGDDAGHRGAGAALGPVRHGDRPGIGSEDRLLWR